jgi:cytochrome b561
MSNLRNTLHNYGTISRALHWLMAIGLIFMLGLGWRIENMEPSLSNLWLYGLHKSIGVTLFLLVLLRLLWHRISPPPPTISEGVSMWQLRVSKGVHAFLYLTMLAIPLSGLLASSATGIETVIFGAITLPQLTPISEAWETALFTAHGILTKLFVVSLALHIAGALQRHFIKRDRSLLRILGL